MILGHINARESENAYSAQVQKAIAYCRETDVSRMKEGRYPHDNGDFIVLINERRTGLKEEKLPEVHREYAELQFMVSGKEYIGFYPDLCDNEIRMDCLGEKDALFYKENYQSGEVMLPLTAGSYAVFFPEDVHRPFCQVDGPEDVKKIVIKIRMSTL